MQDLLKRSHALFYKWDASIDDMFGLSSEITTKLSPLSKNCNCKDVDGNTLCERGMKFNRSIRKLPPVRASDEELEGPMKDQPLSADASPTALSPGYIADSDPEEDKEDPEEDPADHPADG
ncbi:hypothetical protein Tco_1156800 [Tanacetum coccineum]